MKNLTAFQVFMLVISLVIAGLLIFPVVEKKVVEKTYVPYEPWDPDNINVIRDKINSMNEEGAALNQEKRLIDNYKNKLSAGRALVQSLDTVPANTSNSVFQIQPSIVFQDDNKIDSRKRGMSERYDPQSLPIIPLIQSKGIEYASIYVELLRRIGMEFISSYYSAPPDQILQSYLTFNQFARNDTALQLTNGREIQKYKSALLGVINSLDTVLNTRLNDIKLRSAELTSSLDKEKESYRKNRFDINQYAVVIGIPLFIVAALLMYFFGLRNGNKLKDQLDLPNEFKSQDYKTGLSFTLYTITVLLLILSLLILGLAKVIQENALAALLGTTAGYILNNATDKGANPPNNPPKT